MLTISFKLPSNFMVILKYYASKSYKSCQRAKKMLIFKMDIAVSLQDVLARINNAAERSGRNSAEIQLAAVSKTVEVEQIKQGVLAGIRILGENRVQEAKNKIEAFRQMDITNVQWHMIGHLQRNKVKQAVKLFDLIHTVDSLELLKQINKEASKLGKVQDVLIQVKLAEEEIKSGLNPDKLHSLLEASKELDSIKIQGLMTMPPFFDDPEMCRPFFRLLRNILKGMKERGFSLHCLSMGMSNDFTVAIEEGATLVRIGTAIFGERKRLT